jgi:hypothetical protein
MNFLGLTRAGLAVVVMALAGCAKGDDVAAAPGVVEKVADAAKAKGADAFFPFTVGGVTLRVQVVVTQDEQQRGLMGRRDLGPDDGMVFVYPLPQQMSFWMRNTPTPLDIGFFKEDGTLGEVYPMFPYDETPVRSAGADYTMALEVNQGWFAKNGLKPGAKADLGLLAEALRARGFRPERYSVRAE